MVNPAQYPASTTAFTVSSVLWSDLDEVGVDAHVAAVVDEPLRALELVDVGRVHQHRQLAGLRHLELFEDDLLLDVIDDVVAHFAQRGAQGVVEVLGQRGHDRFAEPPACAPPSGFSANVQWYWIPAFAARVCSKLSRWSKYSRHVSGCLRA